jgi:uncharacterized protein
MRLTRCLVLALFVLIVVRVKAQESAPMTLDVQSEEHPYPANRLIDEKSPYLLQHAYNPVDWRPWGEEAFEAAREEGKPIFLSIGYSTCHWCHVMEHESFEDPQVAAMLNSYFICVKVDREERPDIDAVYMKAAAYLGSGGGWPLTIVMTPEGKPYFAGTYIPKYPKFNIEGMMTLMPSLYREYRLNSPEMLDRIESVENRIERNASFTRRIHEQAAEPEIVLQGLLSVFDPAYGGFGRGMKFPRSHQMLFLLEHYRRTNDERALAAVQHTLANIRNGGIYDQLGYGVHRYAVDSVWFVPHFEKMLYNQAQLSMAALRCYELTGDDSARQLAEEIYTYVLRDLRSEGGGFCSAEDADSEGEEGAFYIWRHDELIELLSPEQLTAVENAYGVEPEGNWVERATGERPGTNILHVSPDGREFLAEADEETLAHLETAREILFTEREKRIRPSLDDKVLTDWNGLMIVSFARAGGVLGNEQYATVATEAYDFIKQNLWTEAGLLHRWRDGDAAILGNLTDHANLAWAALEIYGQTHDVAYLEDAVQLMETIRTDFKDPTGGFQMTSSLAEDLLMEPINFDDMAEPSGNSIAFLVFSELARLTGSVEFEAEAADLENLYAPSFSFVYDSRSIAALTVERRLTTSYEILISSPTDGASAAAFLAEIEAALPDANLFVLVRTEENAERLATVAPFTAGQVPQDDKLTAYVCSGGTCLAPTTSVAAILEQVRNLPGSQILIEE